MASIKYLLKNKKDTATIYLRLRHGRQIDFTIKTPFHIDPKRWSAKKGLSKGTTASGKNLNTDLEKLKAEIFANLNGVNDADLITRDWLVNIIYPKAPETRVSDKLTDYFDTYIERRKSECSERFESKTRAVKHFIERMEAHYKETYRIVNVDADFKYKLQTFAESQGYAFNTITGLFKISKTVCNHAANNSGGKIQVSPDLNKITANYKPTENIYLSFAELDKIKALNLSERLNNARDWLLISCFTGQRISDFMRFSNEMLRTEGGTLLIEFTQVKTRKKVAIPVHPEVKHILEKRGGKFPKAISDQRYNDYIKEVCKSADLNELKHGRKRQPGKNSPTVEGMFPKHELVASHVGRRSFATNFYGEIPTAILTAATGHATEKQFLDYIGKSETERAKELAKYWSN